MCVGVVAVFFQKSYLEGGLSEFLFYNIILLKSVGGQSN